MKRNYWLKGNGLLLLAAVFFLVNMGLAAQEYRTYASSIKLEKGWTRYESEDTKVAAIFNSSRKGDTPPGSEAHRFYSGGKAAGGLNKSGNINQVPPDLDWSTTTEIAYVKFQVNVPKAGRYLIKIVYNGDDKKSILVKTNNDPHTIVDLPQRAGGKWDSVFARQIDLRLNGGANTIWVSGTITSGSDWANIDCIDIQDVPLE